LRLERQAGSLSEAAVGFGYTQFSNQLHDYHITQFPHYPIPQCTQSPNVLISATDTGCLITPASANIRTATTPSRKSRFARIRPTAATWCAISATSSEL